MPRIYHRKTQRQNWNKENMADAINEVTENGMMFKTASRTFQVPLMALKRRVKNKNKIAKGSLKHLGGKTTVFNEDQENELIDHILDFETRMYGLTTVDLRRLAFQLAVKNPHNFSHAKQMAGVDWLAGFRKRHPQIALRIPEATSAARARGFNKVVVSKFFDLLKSTFEKYKLPPHRIFNVDETSVSTVPGRNSRTFAKRGRKQVARVTSAERGISATAVICVSAGGVFIPPMIIFNRKRMKAELMDGAPSGTIFGCNDSGWMKLDMFEHWFDHFVHFTKPTKEEPLLLLLDGHLSHTKNLIVVTKAKENNIIILCLPPHTTHKLQPLDVGVMYPFSTYMDQALEKWMNNNPGRTISMFHISKIFSEAYLKASTPNNAINGFKKTGIMPFDSDIFSVVDFAAAAVTDESIEALDQETLGENRENLETPEKNSALCISPIPGPSTRPVTPLIPTECNTSDQRDNKAESSFAITPADCNPLPKIKGKRAAQKRKSVGTIILTSTPYKLMLEEDNRKKLEIEEKRSKKKQSRSFIKKNVKLNIKPKKRVVKNSDSSSESNESQSEECIFCCEKFVNSSKGEGWIRCNKCLKWAHDQCAGVDEDDDNFTCDLCLSHTKTWS